MKLVETKDGTITVIELDPTKIHWIIADLDAMLPDEWRKVRKIDGQIILKRPGRQITVVEGDTMPEGLLRFQGDQP